jgi:hypothetical protein
MPPTEVEKEIEEMTDKVISDDAGEPQGSEQPAAAEPSTAKDVSNRVPDDDPYEIVKDVVASRRGVGQDGYRSSVRKVGVEEELLLVHPETGELWGNIPQTYCMAGVISTGMKLSRDWDDAWVSSP